MTTIDGFEEAMREDLLEAGEEALEDAGDELANTSRENFRAYASRNGYDLEYLLRDIDVSPVRRRGNRLTTTVSWPWGAALWEYGVDPHVIEGDPFLAFYWDSPPEGTRPSGAPSFVKSQSVNWGSVTGGIDESRAIRNALDALSFQVNV